MKKNLFAYIIALLGITGFAACTEDVGTEPGNDPQPVVTLYQYTASSDYDADVTTQLRVAVNSRVSAVYYLAESTSVKEAYVEANGEDAYNQYVVDNGTQATLSDGVADITITDLIGDNTITVVGTGNDGTLCSASATFFGYTWSTLATGSVYAPYMDGTTAFSWASGFELQQRDDDGNVYRIKDLYGSGYHLIFDADGDSTSENEDFFGLDGIGYRNITFETLATPYTYGSYGTISLQDWATYAAASDYLYYNRIYDDYNVTAYCTITVEAGAIIAGFFYFQPD